MNERMMKFKSWNSVLEYMKENKLSMSDVNGYTMDNNTNTIFVDFRKENNEDGGKRN